MIPIPPELTSHGAKKGAMTGNGPLSGLVLRRTPGRRWGTVAPPNRVGLARRKARGRAKKIDKRTPNSENGPPSSVPTPQGSPKTQNAPRALSHPQPRRPAAKAGQPSNERNDRRRSHPHARAVPTNAQSRRQLNTEPPTINNAPRALAIRNLAVRPKRRASPTTNQRST